MKGLFGAEAGVGGGLGALMPSINSRYAEMFVHDLFYEYSIRLREVDYHI